MPKMYNVSVFVKLALFALITSTTYADQRVNLTFSEQIGRTQVFPNLEGPSSILATAFSAALHCSPGSTRKSCTLAVANVLNPEEMVRINALNPGYGVAGTTFISSFEPQVMSVESAFENLDPLLGDAILNSGLRNLMPGAPRYAVAEKRLSTADAQILMEHYATNGIGTWRQRVTLRAREWDELILLAQATHYAQAVATLNGAKTRDRQRLIESLYSAAKLDGLRTTGLTEEETKVILFRETLSRYFVKNIRTRAYRLRAGSAIPSPNQSIVIHASEFLDDNYICESTLELKANSVVSTRCSSGSEAL